MAKNPLCVVTNFRIASTIFFFPNLTLFSCLDVHDPQPDIHIPPGLMKLMREVVVGFDVKEPPSLQAGIVSCDPFSGFSAVPGSTTVKAGGSTSVAETGAGHENTNTNAREQIAFTRPARNLLPI